MTDGRLPFDEAPGPAAAAGALPDAEARAFAVDPTRNVVLEASAGTGKTRVLVDRYVNLLREGVDPGAVLAITFTRKAAAEMRERIVRRLREMAAGGELTKARWQELRTHLGDIAISTIDAFCLALLREFPLEADVDPGFDLADETQVPRLVGESLDATLRICRAQAREHDDVALVFAQLGEPRLRDGLTMLLARRLVAPDALDRFLAGSPRDLTLEAVCTRTARALGDALAQAPGGLSGLLTDGPIHVPAFQALAADLHRVLEAVTRHDPVPPARLRTVIDGIRDLVFTAGNTPRKRVQGSADDYASPAARRRHVETVQVLAGPVGEVIRRFRRDLNVLLARGIRRIYVIAERTYRRTLDAHAVLDFTEVLSRALALLAQMDEFARSRWRLESRYHHVLVDEFQDTNRAQWDLVQLLIQSWGEGLGLASTGPLLPTVFIVGDRKQSIYGFRDADVRVLGEAAGAIGGLRPGDDPRRAISVSFRAVPELLAFVNDLFAAMPAPDRGDAFRYDEPDRFPVAGATGAREALGLAVADDLEGCAEAVAAEIARLLRDAAGVRDRGTGVARPIEPGDIAILFRTRETHRAYEKALERRRIPSYVYKGLGFFESDEIMDVVALLRYLGDPQSDLRASAFLRSRFVRLSDPAIGRLAPRIAGALLHPDIRDRLAALDPDDRAVLELTRASVRGWLDAADRVPPAELLDRILAETAYAYELRGPRWPQARENLKKLRGLVRRIQNRGYATLARVADHLDVLSAGDESNAIVDAVNAVNLMTVHAAKGLEFPVVFLVNLGKGSGGRTPGLRIVADDGAGAASVAVGEGGEDLDEEIKARDREETKRLLYVAVTRARDRLYLSTVVRPGGRSAWARGSLGSVLAPDVQRLFDEAAEIARNGGARVIWTPPAGGHPHAFRLCPPPPAGAPIDALAGAAAAGPSPIDLTPLADRDLLERVPVTAHLAGREPDAAGARRFEAEPEYLVAGTLVHRLLQFAGPPEDDAGDPERQRQRAFALLRPEERVDLEEPGAVVDRAVATFEAIRTRPDVAGPAAAGRVFDEVPFSLRVGPLLLVRGAIDRLVYGPGHAVTVLEFKTGRPRPEHRAQLELYLAAIRALWPDAAVEGDVIYP
ncbi:MAG TPA: UvrD-helicase domain-containing protein [Vicinamibacterales bacterium]|nr:UvrD-helicase domain-containing protein [Vicinamibacterales bacterium]